MITILMQERANRTVLLIQLEAGHCSQKKYKFNRFVDHLICQCGLSYMLGDMDMKDYLFNSSGVLPSDFE